MTPTDAFALFLLIMVVGWILGAFGLIFCYEERKLWDYVTNGEQVRNEARVHRYMHKHGIKGIDLKLEEAQT